MRRLVPFFLLLGCAHPAPKPRPPPPPPAAPVEKPRERPREERARCSLADLKLDTLAPGAAIHITDADFITMKRTACFGTCPVYSVTVKGDGTVSAIGERHVAHEGPFEWNIDKRVAQLLLAEFVRLDVFARDPRMAVHVTDLPSARLSVQIGKRHVELDHRGGGGGLMERFSGGNKDSAVLTRLEQLVDRLSEAETRVVGCSTQHIPSP